MRFVSPPLDVGLSYKKIDIAAKDFPIARGALSVY
jgi:hypothetical protein